MYSWLAFNWLGSLSTRTAIQKNIQALFSKHHPYYKLFSSRSWSPYRCIKNSLIVSSLLILALLIIDTLDTYHKNTTLLEVPSLFCLLFIMCLFYISLALPFKIAFLSCKDLCKVYRTTYPSIAAKEDYSRLNFMFAQWQWVVRESFKDAYKLALALAAAMLIGACVNLATPVDHSLTHNLLEAASIILFPFNLAICALFIFPAAQCLTLIVLRRDLYKTPKMWWSCLITAASWLTFFYCIPWVGKSLGSTGSSMSDINLPFILLSLSLNALCYTTIYLALYCLKAPKLNLRMQ